FTPMKSLMDDQMQGILAAILFAASDQPPAIIEKIFAEIVLASEFPLALLLLLIATCRQQSAKNLKNIL
ncbi:19642_t:CDS:2, partial [Gigaspora rosea]